MVALRPALQHNGGVWFGWSGKVAPADQLETRSVRHKNMSSPTCRSTEYYNGFADRVLWPILHGARR
jgi:trehalose 6-phosphate synthase